VKRVWALLPVALFIALGGLGVWGVLGQRAAKFESQLIGKPAPAFALKSLDGQGEVSLSQFAGRYVVMNYWASWCVPCRAEHPLLMELSRDKRVVLIGLAYKDEPVDASRFLAELGNPFAAIALDPLGQTGIDYGVTGVPETYLIGPDGRVLAKHTGPFEPNDLRDFIAPAVKAASTAR
jgi:cytochrome c biogenesis protein CcmG, thiol:disulfide interchange protein DsbE